MIRMSIAALALTAACAATPRPRAPVDPLAGVGGAELYRIGMAEAQAGDTLRAEQYLAAALVRGYDDAMIPLLRICVTGERYGAALRYAQNRLHARPDDWQLRYLTAELMGAVGRYDDEREQLETLVSEVSDRPEPHFALARVYERDGRPRRAATHYRRYLALAPTGPYAREARRKVAELRQHHRRHRRRH
jgi:predicted Zn-dependent protease